MRWTLPDTSRKIGLLLSRIQGLIRERPPSHAGVLQLFFDAEFSIPDICSICGLSRDEARAIIADLLTAIFSETVTADFDEAPWRVFVSVGDSNEPLARSAEQVIEGCEAQDPLAGRIRRLVGAAIRIETPPFADDSEAEPVPQLVPEAIEEPVREMTDVFPTIDEVWEQFHKTRSSQYRNLLMEHYRDLVRYAAERLHAKLPDKVELDDLVSAGTFGLMDAIDAYDPARGVKFETYCAPRIKGSILDELRSMDWVPRLVRARAHQLAKATHALEMHLGRKPDETQLAEELDMDLEEFARLQRDANAASLVSLNNKCGDAEGEKDVYEIDVIKDHHSEDPLLEAQKRDLKNLLTKGLTRAERLIIVLYYYEEMTMKQIGATLDLSESRVAEMHSSIVARLKAQMNTRNKKEFAVEADSNKVNKIKREEMTK
jgi:RNA polymerase sigma factor for flagellar operon FliA